MTELTDLDGLGPARSDSLEEAGIDSVDALAEAEPDSLAEAADIPEDTVLTFVVQAQNIVEETEKTEDAESDSESEEEEDEPMPADLAEADEEPDTDESEDDEDETEETYALTIDLETDRHYDAYMTALFNAYERRHGSHQPSIDAINKVLDAARYNSGTVELELTEYELNSMHAAISQQQNDYKGDNMIDHMDAMTDVLGQINETREEKLF